MKPRDSSVGGSHSKVLCKSSCSVNESCSTYKRPLLGRCFYLDLPFSKKTEMLERDIRMLGGTIEKFFSKEIKYLVSDKKGARYVRNQGRNSPAPSPNSCQSCSYPSSRRESPKGSSQGLAETVVTSRGKSLVKKVVKKQEQIKINGILSNALEWGVKILYVDDMLSYIEKRKRDLIAQNKLVLCANKDTKSGSTVRGALQKFQCGRISKPFIKVEDSSKHYKPIYHSMPYLPELNFTAAPPCTPFYIDDCGKDGRGRKPKERRNKDQWPVGNQAGSGIKPPKVKSKAPEVRAKKRGGYCECCAVKYETLKMHLKTEQHEAYSKTDAYLVVDRLISGMAFDFVEMNKQTKSEKCSISSVVHISMPRVNLEERRAKELLRDAEGCKVEKNQTDLSQNSPVICRPRKRTRVPLSSSYSPEVLAHSCGPEQRQTFEPDCLCHSAERGVCDRTTMSACRQQAHASTAELGSKHSSSNLAVNEHDHHSHSFVDGGEIFQCSVVAKSPKRICDQSAAAGTLEKPVQTLVTECGQNPETEGVVLQQCAVHSTNSNATGTQSSPLGKLQRKVRDFRRLENAKRRTPDKFLWQLFQSSEDMDYEFEGF